MTVVGLRLRAQSVARAELQWGAILGGEMSRRERGELIYGWERSPLGLSIEIDPTADEGPVAIELTSDRAVALPSGPHPVLGATFVAVT